MVKQLIDKWYKQHGFSKRSAYFVEHAEQIPELVSIATGMDNHPYPESASWLLIGVAEKDPELLKAHQPKIIDRILVSENQSVLRNLTHTCHLLTLISYKEGELLDRLLAFTKDPGSKPALRVYALYKLIQFALHYPEINNEVSESLKSIPRPYAPSLKIAIRNYMKNTGLEI